MFGGLGGNMGGDPFAGQHQQRRPQAKPPKGEDRKINLTVHLKDLAVGKAPVRLGKDRTINVNIPPEAENGQIVRVKGQGADGPGGKGDVLITLAISEHPDFRREGKNLRVHVPVPLSTAVLGGKIRVPTLSGAVALTIPAWTTSGAVFRVRGKGLPGKDDKNGDIFAVLAVELPKTEDRELITSETEVRNYEDSTVRTEHEVPWPIRRIGCLTQVWVQYRAAAIAARQRSIG